MLRRTVPRPMGQFSLLLARTFLSVSHQNLGRENSLKLGGSPFGQSAKTNVVCCVIDTVKRILVETAFRDRRSAKLSFRGERLLAITMLVILVVWGDTECCVDYSMQYYAVKYKTYEPPLRVSSLPCALAKDQVLQRTQREPALNLCRVFKHFMLGVNAL